jgi:pilus assembly protein Flp/PilA
LKNFNLLLNNLIADESGQDLIEYALIASAVALVAVTALASLSGALTTVFGKIVTALNGGTAS